MFDTSVPPEELSKLSLDHKISAPLRDVFNSLITAVQDHATEYDWPNNWLDAHQNRVAGDAKAFLTMLGYGAQACENVALALRIHDLGKIHPLYEPKSWVIEDKNEVTDAIKNDRRLHTLRGDELFIREVLAAGVSLDDPQVILTRAIILYHHERQNGSGYEGRSDMPEWMQAVILCDVWDGDMQKEHVNLGKPDRTPEVQIARMQGTHEDGAKYIGSFDPDLLERYAAHKLGPEYAA